MKHLPFPALAPFLCLLLVVASAPSASAQEEPADTPTNLLELLPEGGYDAVAMDFWLIVDSPEVDDAMYMRWQATPDDDQFTVAMTNGGAAESFMHRQSHTYDAEGQLVTLQEVMDATRTFGTVEGDQLKLVTTTPGQLDGQALPGGVQQTETVTLERGETIPTTWLPLAIGYHLREENPSFTIRMKDYVNALGMQQVMRIENIGTEMMQLGEQEREVHVLTVRIHIESDDPDVDVSTIAAEPVMHLRCLPSGAIVQMKMTEQGTEVIVRAATEQQVREQFGDAAVDGRPAEEAGDGDPQPAEEGAAE